MLNSTPLGRGCAVVIAGPKACGKTETARRPAGSSVMFDVDAKALAAARIEPAPVLDGAIPARGMRGRPNPRSGITSAAPSMSARSRASSS